MLVAWPTKEDFENPHGKVGVHPLCLDWFLKRVMDNRCSVGGLQLSARSRTLFRKIGWGGFGKGLSCNNRFALKPDVAIASEVPILSENSLAIADF